MPAPVPAPLRALLVICLASAGWAFTFGAASQAVSLRMQDAGLGKDGIGWNAGTYYLGMAVVGLAVPGLMRRWGPRCVVAGMALSGAAVALFPCTESPACWFALRFLQGAGGALGLIPLEAFVGQVSAPQHRSRNFSLYALALTAAGALGLTVGLHLYQPGSALAFSVAGASSLAAAGLVLAGLPPVPAGHEPDEGQVPLNLRANFLAYGTAWVQGFLEGGLLHFLPLYLVSLGLGQRSVGNLVGAAMVGVILFQVPTGWLADRLGKRPVLLLCYAVVLAGLVVVPCCAPGPWLGLWLFLVGGCSAALFPVGLAVLGEGQTGGGLNRAYARYTTLDCVGSVVGPVCMGKAQQWAGGPGLFAAGVAAIALVLLCCLGVRLLRYNAEDRGRKTEARRQKTEDRGQEKGHCDAGQHFAA